MNLFPGRGLLHRGIRRVGTEVSRAASSSRRFDLSIFHAFAPPPAGGGHQFLRALKRAWEQRGLRVGVNAISRSTRAGLFNSYNFDPDRLARMRRPGCRLVHRVDGPLAVYRGHDDGTDARIAEWNRALADATILQSQFSLRAHEAMGVSFRHPVVIPNAADPAIFFPPSSRPPRPDGKLRIMAASWSDNPNKGAEVYAWLDRHLDFTRYAFTFAGRLPMSLEHIRHVPPVPSGRLADLLREHDVYLTASRNDPCSNSLTEALACGLPAVYLNSGGHPELVGEAGFGFDRAEEIPALLERLHAELDAVRGRIRPVRISEVAARYLAVLGMPMDGGVG